MIAVGFAIYSNVKTDPIKCAAIGRTIQQLFKGKTTYSVTECIIGSLGATTSTSTTQITTLTPSTVKDSSSTSNTGFIVGVVVGAVVVILILIVIFVFLRREKLLAKESNREVPYQPFEDTNTSPKTNDNRIIPPLYSQETQGTGHSLETNNSQNSRRRVPPDLIVPSNKPLASGVYGEVWLGLYGAQHVANQRLKSRQPDQVQKFIDELFLILDCEYIVKFIGTSWTRPIEIECVVEYMNLGDLCYYLMSQSPYKFTWDEKYKGILSIVQGLSQNVLLDSVKGTKLTDFGTSRVFQVDDTMTNGIGTH
ncbi:hypothetical protein THRCLA_07177 [Thraustotheca clavata]|uniref:Protein kinase domain-containing protein n=1 Tax=Thraustotheca clavata TaxID=74557 RepID=A0A1V9ZFL4_9STRA|nr:hypothetical protein THRCLA_07177 [Thraustotheca clavata]